MDLNKDSIEYEIEGLFDGLRLVGTDPDPDPEFDLAAGPRFSATSLRALNAVEDTSRLIDDLARQLGCLGHFDRSDGPRAA
jgi:hypothetical protein